MCHFITLVTDCSDAAALSKLMKKHGRDAKYQTNKSIQRLLLRGETQFLATAGVCDCSTVLGKRTESTPEENMGKLIERKTESDWSQKKIDRWLADRAKAEARPGHYSDSLDEWVQILSDVLMLPGTKCAGLLLHMYAGKLDSEPISATRREVPANDEMIEQLRMMQEDNLLVFRRV